MSTWTRTFHILQIIKSGILQIQLINPAEQTLPLDHYHSKWQFWLLFLHFLPPRYLISLPYFSAHLCSYSAEQKGRTLLNQQNNFPIHPDKKTNAFLTKKPNTFLTDKQDATTQQTKIRAWTGKEIKQVRKVSLLAIIKY